MNLDALNTQFEAEGPASCLAWVWQTFGDRAAVTSSFQTHSIPLLHMIAQVCPDMRVLFLNTGFHFPETLAFRDRVAAELGLRVVDVTAAMGHTGFARQHGDLYRTDPDMCCYINKVEPLRRATKELDAWVTGIRRDQTPARRTTPIVAVQPDGLVKVAPLAAWTEREIWQYINRWDLPAHPLFEQGYFSIGCAPCTRPVGDGMHPRAGRWAGRAKTECGLHVAASADGRPAYGSDRA